MNLQDDPRLTAYALGEIEDPTERAEIEKQLADHPELAAEVEAVRATTALLEATLANEPLPELSEAELTGMAAGTPGTREAPENRSGKLVPFQALVLSLAACCALALGLWTLNREPGSPPVAAANGHHVVDATESRNIADAMPESPGTADPEREHGSHASHGTHAAVSRDDAIASQALTTADADPGVTVTADAAALPADPAVIATVREQTTAHAPAAARFTGSFGGGVRLHGTEEADESPTLSPFEVPAESDSGFDLSIRATDTGAKTTTPPAGVERSMALGTAAATSFADSSRARREVFHPDHPHPGPIPPPPPYPHPQPPTVPTDFSTESYDRIFENDFRAPGVHPLSTFSIDVDTASYANVRRFLLDRRRPPRDAVRIEELLNYFTYEYAAPETPQEPLKAEMEVADAPWERDHRLVRVGLKGYEMDWNERPSSNLVFLVDVSGSMRPPNKLPLVQRALTTLVRRLDDRDRVAIVTYAGSSRVALPSTTANNTETIIQAIEQLGAGGSTHGSAGIEEAYRIARRHFIARANNRVVLCTDGDFNVGTTDRGELVQLVENNARTGIFLSIFGFGMGNYQDATLEELSNKGDGNYAYIDSVSEARKVFIDQVAGTLHTIARDVKIQVEFNPATVAAYRLIGYENRALAKEDFNDDTKDAGELGAGHTVTALYEIVPSSVGFEGSEVDPLQYQKPAIDRIAESVVSEELLTLKVRYKLPDEETSRLAEFPLKDDGRHFEEASEDFRFSSAVAGFGMLLRDSKYKGESTWDMVRRIAEEAQGDNKGGYRSEFLMLIDEAEGVVGKAPAGDDLEDPERNPG